MIQIHFHQHHLDDEEQDVDEVDDLLYLLTDEKGKKSMNFSSHQVRPEHVPTYVD